MDSGSIRVGLDDLDWPLTRISRSPYTYKSNISKTGTRLGTRNCSTLIRNYTWHIERCHVRWPWLTSKRVARVCQDQLSFLYSLKPQESSVQHWQSGACRKSVNIVHKQRAVWTLSSSAADTDTELQRSEVSSAQKPRLLVLLLPTATGSTGETDWRQSIIRQAPCTGKLRQLATVNHAALALWWSDVDTWKVAGNYSDECTWADDIACYVR